MHEACAQPVQAGLFGERDGPRPPRSRSGRSATGRRAREVAPGRPAAAGGATSVYTDGACSGNPGPGGWAWAVADGRQGLGGAPATTNQRMEIQAALEAVRALDDSPLVVVSDSTYVVNCFRDALVAWLAVARVADVPEEAGRQPRPLGAAGRAGQRPRRRDVPVGERAFRRPDERPGRPARRGRVAAPARPLTPRSGFSGGGAGRGTCRRCRAGAARAGRTARRRCPRPDAPPGRRTDSAASTSSTSAPALDDVRDDEPGLPQVRAAGRVGDDATPAGSRRAHW